MTELHAAPARSSQPTDPVPAALVGYAQHHPLLSRMLLRHWPGFQITIRRDGNRSTLALTSGVYMRVVTHAGGTVIVAGLEEAPGIIPPGTLPEERMVFTHLTDAELAPLRLCFESGGWALMTFVHEVDGNWLTLPEAFAVNRFVTID
jgi:hypothetical protein